MLTGRDDAPHALGDDLVLRWSTAADTERLAALTSSVFREAKDEPANVETAASIRAVMNGDYPLIAPGDFALVEDTGTGRIAACACLLAQVWRYGGVALPVGRPEAVATDPAYRRRGLVRAIFGLLHARSDARGDLAQAITGIPYFYRQFGYAYALDLGGERYVALADIPDELPEHPDSVTLQPATEADVPFLAALYERSFARSLVSAEIPLDYWRYKLATAATSNSDWRLLIIAEGAGSPIGFLNVQPHRTSTTWMVHQLEAAPGIGLQALVLPVLRRLKQLAPTLPTFKPLEPAAVINFRLGREHPWYEALGQRLAPRGRPPYAWYVRVANLPRLLLHLAPVLEVRLAASVAAGHSGDLRLDFYRGGLRLVFERGKLALAEDWQRPDWSARDHAAFPPLVFLPLLFGYRSLPELCAAHPDVSCPEDLEPLLCALFPPAVSTVLPLG
ncbi:MAG: GNAT family N-acetyltransferase [Chloroflexota bacterium]